VELLNVILLALNDSDVDPQYTESLRAQRET